ncbi:MAG: creatininase family protein [Pseudomonadota bacterium]
MLESVFDNLVAYFQLQAGPTSRIFPLYLATSFVLALFAFWQVEKAHAAEHGHDHDGSDREGEARPTFFQYVFNPRIIFHPSTRQDVKFFFVNSLVYYALIAQFLLGVHFFSGLYHSGLVAVFGELSAPALSTGAGILLYTLVAAMMVDLGIFVAHYLFHRVPVLWEFHKVHHSAEELNPMTLFRMHPVDLFLTSLIVALLSGLAFAGMFYLTGNTPSAIGLFGLNIITFLFYVFGYNLRHSHIWLNYPEWLSRILISPAQHQIHHSSDPKHFDKNFGLMFSFWDQLAGTSYIPRTYEKLKYGLSRAEPNPFKSIADIYVKPFVWAGDIVRDAMQVPEQRRRALIGVFAALAVIVLGQQWHIRSQVAAGPAVPSVKLANLTWTEVDTAIGKGYTTVIVPTGGTEQNGPFVVLGKHRIVVDHTSHEVAHALGKTLVAPVMDYVPEGGTEENASGHMKFAGTLSVPESVFEAVLEHTARSLKTHGFKEIYFMGDSGGNQASQKRVAAKLAAEWAGSGTSVDSLDQYYSGNRQFATLQQAGYSDKEIGWHAGMRDTSEVLAIAPSHVRMSKKNLLDRDNLGFSGAAGQASAKIGRAMLKLKIQAAVTQVRALRDARAAMPRGDKLADASGG